YFIYVKRISTCDRINVFSIITFFVGKLLNRFFRQRRQFKSRKRVGWQISQDISQRGLLVDFVVPRSNDKQTPCTADSSCKEFYEVECCFISPVDVFEYNYDWSLFVCKDLYKSGKQFCPRRNGMNLIDPILVDL